MHHEELGAVALLAATPDTPLACLTCTLQDPHGRLRIGDVDAAVGFLTGSPHPLPPSQ